MLMRKNVKNDGSKDSPIGRTEKQGKKYGKCFKFNATIFKTYLAELHPRSDLPGGGLGLSKSSR